MTSYARQVTRSLFAHHIGRWVVGGRALSNSPIGDGYFESKQKIKKGALTVRAYLSWSLLQRSPNLCC